MNALQSISAREMTRRQLEPDMLRTKNRVAQFYRVTRAALESERRDAAVTWPRFVAMFIIREEFNASLPKIAREFGNRDHTTALNAIRRVAARIAIDRPFACEVRALRKAVRA